jgi:hypothetical protein
VCSRISFFRKLPDLLDAPLHVAERERMHGFAQPVEGIAREGVLVLALLGRELKEGQNVLDGDRNAVARGRGIGRVEIVRHGGIDRTERSEGVM